MSYSLATALAVAIGLQRIQAEGWERAAPVRGHIPGDAADVQGVGGVNQILFRGTTSGCQWADNFRVRRESALIQHVNGQGRVHTGFAGASAAMRHQLVLDPRLPVRLGGYSRGGAVAAITAYNLHLAGYQVESVHLFDAPRAGDRAWAAHYNRTLGVRTFRHIYCSDIVSRAPSTIRGYADVGRLMYFDRREQFHPDLADRPVMDRIHALIGHIGLPGLRYVHDHGIHHFPPMLQRALSDTRNQ